MIALLQFESVLACIAYTYKGVLCLFSVGNASLTPGRSYLLPMHTRSM